jgi:diguanylate cyclase (GGDEF)-like protein
MGHGSDRIQDFIRQASSLHTVNTVYSIGLLIVLMFCYEMSSTESVSIGLIDFSSWGMGLLFLFKISMQFSKYMQKSLRDEEFELLVALGNAVCTFMIMTTISESPESSVFLGFFVFFVPTLLFVLITPLTWRKRHSGFIGVFGFVEWSLLISIILWMGDVFVDMFMFEKWWALLSNVIVCISPVFLKFIRQRYVNKLTERMHKEIYTDPLTQVSNRKCFYDYYDNVRDKNKSQTLDGEGLVVVFVDIDHFKQYNDFYGHDEGDNCLKLVASHLDTLAKDIGMSVFRVGGEEFVICGMTTASDWRELKNYHWVVKWLDANMPLDIKHEKSPSGVLTISGGASFIPRSKIYTMNAVGITKRADACLYEAKGAGRGVLVIDPDES